MGRAPCCDKEGVKKGPWTPEEDLVLVSYVQDHGAANWRAVPAKTGLMRCSKSCRLRWTNYLRPGIRRGGFSEQEDRLIVHLQALLGNRWAAIASYLPNRTDNDVKNYWNTHLKKRLMLHHQHHQQRALAPSPPPPPPCKGQWEHRLQADVDHARRALREALSVDATGPTGGGAITTPALMMSGEPPQQQAYALSARSVSRMLLDGWAATPAGKSPAATPPPRATESASVSTSELTDSSGGSTSSPSKCATRVAGPLFGRRESAGHGELSAIESWLLEDGGDDELQPAQEGLLLDAALHNFAV
ncbi:hypothetical protein ACP70R_048922 [Stipagrostis hirtigluma subsp. patula]